MMRQEQEIVLTPPAWAIRREAGLALPSIPNIMQAAVGTIVGSGASAIFIGAMGSADARFVGALISGAIGLYFAAVSPLFTIPHEIGLGMVCTSASHLYYALAHQYKTE